MNSYSSARPHVELPIAVPQVQLNGQYYEAKQIRCLDAFSRSEFEVAYAICTPLAKVGYKDAQLVMGLLYAFGEGVDKDLHRAKQWLNEAHKNGQSQAGLALNELGIN
ncbi:MAG: sel1 repeat family protein [Kordiimonadaceae bacterium]|nr:sel1 repeat family protein [Kordiimonadaceae bacterium]